MTKKEITALRDLQAFINFGIEKNLSFMNVLMNIAHDVSGLARPEDKFFLPRTHGYAKKEVKVK